MTLEGYACEVGIFPQITRARAAVGKRLPPQNILRQRLDAHPLDLGTGLERPVDFIGNLLDSEGWGELSSGSGKGIVAAMTSVSITDLKANLSHYIRELRNGGEIEVLNRGTPVARITPPQSGSDKSLDALVRAGVLTPGRGCAEAVLERPPIDLPVSLLEALLEDRGDRV